MKRIDVTKAYLPPKSEYDDYLKQIWETAGLTNGGKLHKEFEEGLKQYLGVNHVKFVANGTLALQLSIRALGITKGEIITTPFSYVATTSAILWEHCKPVFVDIDPETLCIDPSKIEAAITENTKAILPVHVFGNPCDIDAIDAIAKKYSLKVIYDGAHAFGVKYNDRSLLDYGDISISSFHATKPFHTIEGGCVVSKHSSVDKQIELMKRFGHNGDEHFQLGINAKPSEFNAAMGLCNLSHVADNIEKRKKLSQLYSDQLHDKFQRQAISQNVHYNYSYYPIIFQSESDLLKSVMKLNDNNIFPRRYFYPSLNTLPYLDGATYNCPISEDISQRILCLPLYGQLEEETVNRICELLKV